MQWKGERLALKTLGPQRKSFNALGTTRSTLFAEMFLGEKFVCIIWLRPTPVMIWTLVATAPEVRTERSNRLSSSGGPAALRAGSQGREPSEG